MHELLEFAVRGVFLGIIYGLVALPISLLFLTTDSVDLSVGAYAVLAGAVTIMVGGPLGMALGVATAILASGIVATLSLRLNRPGQQDPVTVVLATFGAATFLESFILTWYGKDPMVRQPFQGFWDIAGVRISPQSAVNLAVGLGILAALSAALYRTPFGRAMRACAINPIGATLAGIPARGIWFATYVIGGAMAGIAGVLILNTTGMDYSSGLSLTIAAFGASILFGLKNPARAFSGGLAMGVVQALSAGYLPGAWATAMPLAFTFIVLSSGRMTRIAAGGRA
ncbi:MAG: branched-chain amino acid ABC transporter permease [Rhodospirillales bacterium]|nr:branched-chain amino acid ABC transporter permease [Rhodospirillales bacterium]